MRHAAQPRRGSRRIRFRKDPDAEPERPEQVSPIDTETGTMRPVGIGTSYTFRSSARCPHGEALVLGTDGRTHVIDPGTGKVTKLPAPGSWQEPLGRQQPRPARFVRDRTAYVSDPSAGKLLAIGIGTREAGGFDDPRRGPAELSGVKGHRPPHLRNGGRATRSGPLTPRPRMANF